jgi:hypothetical protein
MFAGALTLGLMFFAATAPQERTPREERLALAGEALRERIARLESSGGHAALMAAVSAALDIKHLKGTPCVDLEGAWCLTRHELSFVAEINAPTPGKPDGPIRALDFEIENHALHVISAYSRELAERDIELLVLPVPNRAQVWCDRLPGGANASGGDLGTARLLLALNEAGVEVIDLIPVFAAEHARLGRTEGERLYRNFNPHWAPNGVRIAADVLAERVRRMEWYEPGPHREGVDFVRVEEDLQHKFRAHGDAPDEPPTFHFERVLDPEGKLVPQKDKQSPVLILGDSYSDIYKIEGAGLAVQLYARLGYEMDRIAVSSGGANSVWQSLARRKEGLAGKKVVIWVFRMTELDNPDLRKVGIFPQ